MTTNNTEREAFEDWFEKWRISIWRPLPSDEMQECPKHWAINAKNHMQIAWLSAKSDSEKEIAELKADLETYVTVANDNAKIIAELQAQMNVLREALEDVKRINWIEQEIVSIDTIDLDEGFGWIFSQYYQGEKEPRELYRSYKEDLRASIDDAIRALIPSTQAPDKP